MFPPNRANDGNRKVKVMRGVIPPRSRLNYEQRTAMVNEGQGFEKKSYHVLVPGPHPDDRNN